VSAENPQFRVYNPERPERVAVIDKAEKMIVDLIMPFLTGKDTRKVIRSLPLIQSEGSDPEIAIEMPGELDAVNRVLYDRIYRQTGARRATFHVEDVRKGEGYQQLVRRTVGSRSSFMEVTEYERIGSESFPLSTEIRFIHGFF